MRCRRVARTLSVWLLAGFAAALLGGCSSGASSCAGCQNTLTITGAVPAIGQQTWAAHVCFDGSCEDVTLDASNLDAYGKYGDEVRLAEKNGGWQLTVEFHVGGTPGSGDTWSVKVVNGRGSVITQGSGAVKWQGTNGPCTCRYATATIP